MKFLNKVVWITGASSGIGEATAYAFAREGARLILSARREDELNRVKNNCQQWTSECKVIPIDLTAPETIQKATKMVMEEIGSIDVLFNNGGISQRSYFFETSMEVDRQVMEIDYFGHVALTKAVIPYMLKQGKGHIAINTSITGKFGFPLRSAYSASKHALHGFFDSARAELHDKNIQVTIICPGRIQSNISINAVTSDGKKYGKMDEGQAKGLPADKCANKIVCAIYHKKKEVLIGGNEVLMVYIRKFIPGLYYKLAAKVKPT
jgi:short-subunit dehydrogenase